jgi:hypothetical protein
MDRHVKIVAILNIVWGSMGVIGALVFMLIFGGALGILGAVVPGDGGGAGVAIPIVGAIGTVVVSIILITSIPSILAGIGLLRLAPWSRILAIIISALHLANVPFGTALGIYGLWALLSRDTHYLFEADHPPVEI